MSKQVKTHPLDYLTKAQLRDIGVSILHEIKQVNNYYKITSIDKTSVYNSVGTMYFDMEYKYQNINMVFQFSLFYHTDNKLGTIHFPYICRLIFSPINSLEIKSGTFSDFNAGKNIKFKKYYQKALIKYNKEKITQC